MSLDLHLVSEDGENYCSLNWLRNPYGLCQWAEDNVKLPDEVEEALLAWAKRHDETDPPEKYPRTAEKGFLLWFVCNRWCYEKGKDVDKKLFEAVVKAYATEVLKLEIGYYFFDFGSYRQFVEPHRRLMPANEEGEIRGAVWHTEPRWKRSEIAIPMRHFATDSIGDDVTFRDNCFVFDFQTYRKYVERYRPRLPLDGSDGGSRYGGADRIEGETWHVGEAPRERLAIPMDNFKSYDFHLGDHYKLDYYKKWMTHLVEFSEELQNEKVGFHGTN